MVWAGLVPPEGSGEGSVPCLSPSFLGWLAIFHVPWFVEALLPTGPHLLKWGGQREGWAQGGGRQEGEDLAADFRGRSENRTPGPQPPAGATHLASQLHHPGPQPVSPAPRPVCPLSSFRQVAAGREPV